MMSRAKVDQCANELLAFLIRERVEPEAQSETVGDWSRTFAQSASPRHARRCTGSPAAGWLGPA